MTIVALQAALDALPDTPEGYRRGLSMAETVKLRPKASVTITCTQRSVGG
jgi:hypothetical protein